MPSPLKDRHVVLGVTGSIASYKALDLASRLVQAGALVDVVLSYGATQFVTPLAFRALTHRPVVTDTFDPASELAVEHVMLAERAAAVVVAPATAHLLARVAHGLADDPLATTILATRAPVLLAPAMDGHMWDAPATQENVATLRARGVTIVGPAAGRLASGQVGMGRLVEPSEIVGYLCALLGRGGDLAGRTVVVSAGGTQEPIDPVRVVTNRSSGKMGYALAEAARDRGARAVLVTAPTALPDPAAVEVVRVQTAVEMRDAIFARLPSCDVLLMAAAVADYRPARLHPQKVKKERGGERWVLELVKNPDILAEAHGSFVKVGFAAESEHLVEYAREKVRSKGLDLIAANDITASDSGFGADTNRVVLVDREGRVEELPLLPKYEVAHCILDRVAPLLPPRR